MAQFKSDTDQEGKAIAVVGPDRGVGRSWVAANLAVIFSQLGKTTVLVDSDFRHSSQHRLFGLDNSQGLSEILCGRVPLSNVAKHNRILENLTVITAGAAPPNPQEILGRKSFEQLMSALKKTADVIILDTPSDSRCADGELIAMRAKGAILIARRNVSRPSSLYSYAQILRAADVKLYASVLTDK
jgi:receptor protein-tyrosine kinase